MKDLSMHIRRGIVEMFTILGTGQIALGENTLSTPGNQEPGFLWILLQSIGALLLVMVGIYVFVWLLKQLMNRTGGHMPSGISAHFQVLSRMAISPKHSLYAIRSFDDLFIVASSESEISLLHRYENFEQWDAFDVKKNAGQNGFEKLFQRVLRKE